MFIVVLYPQANTTVDATNTTTSNGFLIFLNESQASFDVSDPSPGSPEASSPSITGKLRKNLVLTIPSVITNIDNTTTEIPNGPAKLSLTTANQPGVSGLIISCAGRIILNSYIQNGVETTEINVIIANK